MAVTDEMVSIACEISPAHSCLVPEKREELTTEGGPDVLGQFPRGLGDSAADSSRYRRQHLLTRPDSIEGSCRCGRPGWCGCLCRGPRNHRTVGRRCLWPRIGVGGQRRARMDLNNVAAVAALPGMHELNIGYSIVGRALYGIACGRGRMRQLISQCSSMILGIGTDLTQVSRVDALYSVQQAVFSSGVECRRAPRTQPITASFLPTAGPPKKRPPKPGYGHW